MSPLPIGATAPDFTLRDQDNQPVTLSSYRGTKNVLLVFYPLAFTGTCQGELCRVRDALPQFENDTTATLAISVGPPPTHKVWAAELGYTFPLLSDFWPHGEVSRQYGVFDEEGGFAHRGTFFLDPDGVVRWALRNEPGAARDFSGFHATLASIIGAD